MTVLNLFFLAIFSANVYATDEMHVNRNEEFQRFDGMYYNGLFYPRIDISEWEEKNTPAQLEFHVYQKDKPVDVSGRVVKAGAQQIFEFSYDLGYRGEIRCRRVPAAAGMREGQKLYYYKDTSDADMDRIIVSQVEMKNKKPYPMKAYVGCEEHAANSVKMPGAPASPSHTENSESQENGEMAREVSSVHSVREEMKEAPRQEHLEPGIEGFPEVPPQPESAPKRSYFWD